MLGYLAQVEWNLELNSQRVGPVMYYLLRDRCMCGADQYKIRTFYATIAYKRGKDGGKRPFDCPLLSIVHGL